MKPLDKRLLKYAEAAKKYLLFIVVTGIISTLLTIAQILLISAAISPVITETASYTQVKPYILTLVCILIARVGLTYLHRAYAHRAANQAIAQLRNKVLDKATQLGPRWLSTHATDTVTLTTRGLDDLGPYFINYLPQLVLTAITTPMALLVMLYLDFLSAFVAAVTIPLIPIFMILVGKLTQDYSQQKLRTMERLGSQLLDLIAGLPTLKALGREAAPTAHVTHLGKTHARTTMQTLRVAFLSGGILEFIATLSVALVAVEVGVRLVSDSVSLFAGLAIIMLAPEVYAPLREVGKNYHASADGVAAANAAFQILEEPLPKELTDLETSNPVTASSPLDLANLENLTITFKNVSVAARGAWAPADLNAEIPAGSISALVGISGAGKTTTVLTLLGLLPVTRGEIQLLPYSQNPQKTTPIAISDIPQSTWWKHVTWVPQSPAIIPGTILENVAPLQVNQLPQMNPPQADFLKRLEEAAAATGFDQVVSSLKDGWYTRIGYGGVGLSVGQRQRLALTRALLNPTSLVILDEPTAHLDSMTESQVIKTIETLQQLGSTIVVIAHRQALIQVATHVIPVTARPATAAELQTYPQLRTDTLEAENLLEIPHLLKDLLKEPAAEETA